MNDTKNPHHETGRPDTDSTIEAHRPYWTRAHHDWRFWVVLVVMIAAMVIYISSQDLSMGPRARPGQPVPENVVSP